VGNYGAKVTLVADEIELHPVVRITNVTYVP
jgi:hypothetical protein